MKFKNLLLAAAATVAMTANASAASAQDAAAPEEELRRTETIVTIGTRVADRSALDTAAAVDVVSEAAI